MKQGNRGEAERAAIAESLQSEGQQEKEGKLSSPFVWRSEGIPNDPATLDALNEWANVWGNEINPTMGDEGLFDDQNPNHVEAMNKLKAAAEKVSSQIPNVKFLCGALIFEGGYLQLSI
jgi:hypothetical protein